jgi:hypothetical protein
MESARFSHIVFSRVIRHPGYHAATMSALAVQGKNPPFHPGEIKTLLSIIGNCAHRHSSDFF